MRWSSDYFAKIFQSLLKHFLFVSLVFIHTAGQFTLVSAQLTLTGSKSAMEKLEKGVKYVQS